jgi:hypothetical protein
MTTQTVLARYFTEERDERQACSDCGKRARVVVIEALYLGSGGYDEDEVLCRPCYRKVLTACGIE